MIKSPSLTHAAGSGALKTLIRAYQLLVSPLLGHNCRYLPNCSAYAIEAVERHGPLSGSWLAAKRVCRCHPWGGEGLDPVPTPVSNNEPNKTSSDHASAAVSSRG